MDKFSCALSLACEAAVATLSMSVTNEGEIIEVGGRNISMGQYVSFLGSGAVYTAICVR